jgi:hypothetical protein
MRATVPSDEQHYRARAYCNWHWYGLLACQRLLKRCAIALYTAH